MTEHQTKITDNSYISVGLFAALMMVIISAVWFSAGIAKQTEINTLNIQELGRQIASKPSREEFDNFGKVIEEIKADVKILIKEKAL